MSDALAKYMKGAQKGADKNGRMPDRPRNDKALPPKEAQALRKIQSMAKEKGAVLASGGRGGLPPSLALGVFKRDDFKCTYKDKKTGKICGTSGTDDNPLTLHHLGGVPGKSKWLSKEGHKNEAQNIATVCTKDHDRIHTEARAKGQDSSQVLAEGDQGNPRRDHGQPLAHPKNAGSKSAGTKGPILS